ncbi:MAG: hypothetical protein PHR77_17400, partial [Kiritimatiellae bacterium]|nr:hypothetical protein [Kiritimatiellia bacterium]
MKTLAQQWQRECKLSKIDAARLIRCVLVPEHFAYMTVVIYNAVGQKPKVLVKFPTCAEYSEERYPLIYKVADAPDKAAEAFVKALSQLIEDNQHCQVVKHLDLGFV